jgi:hypothetical protein
LLDNDEALSDVDKKRIIKQASTIPNLDMNDMDEEDKLNDLDSPKRSTFKANEGDAKEASNLKNFTPKVYKENEVGLSNMDDESNNQNDDEESDNSGYGMALGAARYQHTYEENVTEDIDVQFLYDINDIDNDDQEGGDKKSDKEDQKVDEEEDKQEIDENAKDETIEDQKQPDTVNEPTQPEVENPEQDPAEDVPFETKLEEGKPSQVLTHFV